MTDAIHQEVTVNAAPARVYEAYMDSEQHKAFTGGADADISNDTGGEFTCHGGYITGRNIELVPNRRIVQAWRSQGWDEGVYSVVKIELNESDGKTKLVLDHTGFPDGEKENLEKGWTMRYWEPMNEYLK